MKFEEIKLRNEECFGETFTLYHSKDSASQGRCLILNKQPVVITTPSGGYASVEHKTLTVNGKPRPYLEFRLFSDEGLPANGKIRVDVVYDMADSIEKLYDKLTNKE
jgi:hypothetical protein